MSSRRLLSGRIVRTILLLSGLGLAPAANADGEDARIAEKFLRELKTRGLYEIALEYITDLRADTSIPPTLRALLDYEEGRTLIEQASRSGDLVLREELLKEARTKLESFVKDHADLPQSREALVSMAKLLTERGFLASLQSEEATDKAKKDAKLAEARSSFVQSSEIYGKAVDRLGAALKTFPNFLEKTDPRFAERQEVIDSHLNAQLQKGVTDYELGETYPAGSKERTDALKTAGELFENLYKNNREQYAGIAAQMFQAKCFEEQGNVDAAVGIYKQLLEHTDPRLRVLQRNVGYFYIVALGKRKQYPLAADEAGRWLAKYSGRDDRRTREGLGVMLEFAKNIDAQMAEISSNSEKTAATRKIVDTLVQVVRYPSQFKNEAIALLKKYRPASALRAEDIARLAYPELMEKGEDAIASRDWDRAALILKLAVQKADPNRDIDKANLARYELAFCYFMSNKSYEAAVLSEHLARRYPRGGSSAKAGEIGMQALADAYSSFKDIDRASDLNALVDLARYIAETWPEKEEGDYARLNLGQIYHGKGQFDEAIAILSQVRRRSSKWSDAQTRLGAAHWSKSRALERKGDESAAKSEGDVAIDILTKALESRKESGVPPTDPALIGNVGDLAIALTESGRATDALALLDPILKAQTVRTGPVFARLIDAQLRAFIAGNRVEDAIAAMKNLEQAGGGTGITQLYFRLGKLLEKELENLREKKDMAGLMRTQKSYQAFLTTLAASKSGQSYESLQWAGESLLGLEAYEDAEKVFQRVLTEFTNDPQFLQQPGGRKSMLRTRLKLAAAMRSQALRDATPAARRSGSAAKSGSKSFDEVSSMVEELISQNPRMVEPLMEKGMLLEAMAQAGQGNWSTALDFWQKLAKNLERLKPRPVLYYDAWYHVAQCQLGQKNSQRARQTLLGVMRLSPSVGSPEMKAKYQSLLTRAQ
jgi:tetratricopeptide (TPR) repeat protein